MEAKMDLKDFVKESLVQISQGIEEANKELAGSHAIINPFNIILNNSGSQGYGCTTNPSGNYDPLSRVVEKVNFDVAVVAKTSDEKNIGATLSIANFGVKGGEKAANSDHSESRISFSIPVVFPGVNNQN